MNRSTPGLPDHHQLPEFTHTHGHRVSDAIQPSHPLLPLLLLFLLAGYLLEASILSIGYKTSSDLRALGHVFLLLELSIINSLLLSDLLQLILKIHIKD